MGKREDWLRSLEPGDGVLTETMLGFWLRGRVTKAWNEGRLGVRYGVPDAGGEWLPQLVGLAEGDRADLPPERVAQLTERPPRALPPLGPVLVHYAERRLMSGELVGEECGRGRVLFDEGDEELFASARILLRGAPDAAKVKGLEEQGFVVGAAVLERGKGDQWNRGWVSQVGSGAVYVRFERASHGRWRSVGDGGRGRRGREVRLGGKLKPPREHLRRSVGPLEPGAEVRARWSDRVFYDGRVAALREREGRREVEVLFEDGSQQWVPEARVVVTREAVPDAPQHAERQPLGREPWAEGSRVLARDRHGVWRRATVQASAGHDVLVAWRSERGWVRPRDLAVPLLDDGHFPAKGTAVVEHGEGPMYTGRAGVVVGDRIEVKRDGGEKVLVKRKTLWRRALPREPVEVPPWAEERAVVEARVGREEWVEVVVTKHARYGVRVREPEGRTHTVHPARLRPLPAPPPPPPPPPEPAPEPPREPVEEMAPLTPDEEAARLVQLVALAWARGGYRGGHGTDRGRTALPVERGELHLEVASADGGRYRITVTASFGVEGAPPVDAATVGVAAWLARLFGGPTAEEVREAADARWAVGLFPQPSRTERAGGALSVSFPHQGLPPPGDVVRWARAVHAHLLGDDALDDAG